MIKNKKGESLVGIVIGMFILGIVLIGIINIINFNQNISSNYKDEIYKYVIKVNSDNIIKKIDTSNVAYQENFYLYKDKQNKEFKIFTGAENKKYGYVDKLGNLVNPEKNIGKTYKRIFNNKIDVLKHSLNPKEIPNLVFQFDATNIDGNNNISLSNGQKINIWKDIENNLNAKQNSTEQQPILKLDKINGNPGVYFDGDNDIFKIEQNILINNDGDCYSNRAFGEKSFAIVLKTGFDITNTQFIYEQGEKGTGYNFVISGGNIYAGIHNKADKFYKCSQYSETDSNFYYKWDFGHKFKSVNLGEVLPDTIYFIMIVQDSKNSLDEENKLQIFLNGILVMETDHVDPQPEHGEIGLGGINQHNISPWFPYSTISCDECNYFEGTIGEFISWNHALSKNEVRGIQNYFKQKWLGGNQNIFYNIIENETKKFNNY